MITTNTLVELESIADDISSIITTVVRYLDCLYQGKDVAGKPEKIKVELNQLKGIFTLLNLDGAQLLVAETDNALDHLISSSGKEMTAKIFRVTSDALAILSRYIEYVCQKSVSSPQLLLPIINQLRQVNRLPVYKESIFFVLPENMEEILNSTENSDFGTSVLDLDLQKIRYLRQMFQVGLIEVIRRSNLKGGFKMMRRSLLRTNKEYRTFSRPDMWLTAQCMVEGYLSGGLVINPQRIKVLSLVDRQYRLLEFADLKKSQSDENNSVMSEILYLVSLSKSKTKDTQDLIKKYQLYHDREDDVNFEPGAESLSSPTSKDLRSLNNEILEELVQVESSLFSSIVNTKEVNKTLFSTIENLASLLLAVQLIKESHKLSLVTAIFRKAVEENQALSTSDLKISQGVVQDLRELFEKNDLSTLSPSTKFSRQKLNEEQQAACHIASQHIAKAVTQFDLYAKQSGNIKPLKVVAKELVSAIGGMQALKLTQLIDVTTTCVKLINKMQLGEYSQQKLLILLQFMADAIGSLEFYLETIGKNRTPSPRVIEFANESIKELKKLLVTSWK